VCDFWEPYVQIHPGLPFPACIFFLTSFLDYLRQLMLRIHEVLENVTDVLKDTEQHAKEDV
jgi:hypothetical protein